MTKQTKHVTKQEEVKAPKVKWIDVSTPPENEININPQTTYTVQLDDGSEKEAFYYNNEWYDADQKWIKYNPVKYKEL